MGTFKIFFKIHRKVSKTPFHPKIKDYSVYNEQLSSVSRSVNIVEEFR